MVFLKTGLRLETSTSTLSSANKLRHIRLLWILGKNSLITKYTFTLKIYGTLLETGSR